MHVLADWVLIFKVKTCGESTGAGQYKVPFESAVLNQSSRSNKQTTMTDFTTLGMGLTEVPNGLTAGIWVHRHLQIMRELVGRILGNFHLLTPSKSRYLLW